MAVSWGAWEYGSGNGMRVGVEATAEAVSHGEAACTITVDYWTDNQYSWNDGQTMNFGGSIGGSSGFTNNDGATAVKRFTKTYTYTYSGSSYGSSPGSRTFSCSISGAYNGITPSASDTVSLPARPIASPAAVTSAAASRISDESTKISWVNHPTAGEPYSSNTQVERYVYAYKPAGGTVDYAGAAWDTIAYVSGSSTSYTHANVLPNRRWYYRVIARNSAGNAAADGTNILYTTPATPTACTRYDMGANQRITWTNNVYYAEYAIEVWHAANGVWDASPLVTYAAEVTEHVHSAPASGVKHKYRVRAKTTSGTVLYSSYSGETTETPGSTSPPLTPTNLGPATPTVADRDASIVFTWTHTKSTDGSAQTAFSLQHREVGSSTWTVVPKTTSVASNYTLAHSYGYSTEIEWQVQTWGADPVASPWSAVTRFFTSEPVPRRYPMYLDVTSGRVEADSTPDSGGGGIQWGSWNSVSRNASWSSGTIRYRRSLDGSLVQLDMVNLMLATAQDTASQGNISPDVVICALPADAYPETLNVVTFDLIFGGAYILFGGVYANGLVVVFGASASSYNVSTVSQAHASIVYGTPSTGGGSLGLAPLVVQEEGSPVMPGTTTLNFIGAGVTATSAGAGAANVTITGGAPQAHTHVEADLPTTLATDTEVSTAVANHAAAADPHTGYQRETEKAAANGYASLDGTTKVPIAQVPTGTSGTTVALGSHGHALTDANITGILPSAQLPTHAHTITDLPVAPSGTSNTTQVVRADDSRLSNARTPSAHVHTITDLPVAPSGTSNTTQVVRADDARLSDARTPSAHTHTKANITDFAHTHAAADVTSGAFVVDRLGASPAATTYLKGAATAGTATWVVPSTLKTDLALVKGDVGLGSVDNTADTAKPVSTAQATAIGLKATDTAVVHLANAETVTGLKTFTSAIGMSEQASTPTTPASGFARLYAKTDGLPYYLGDDGVERQLIPAILALHENPGFEGTYYNSSNATTLIGQTPPGYNMFWCSDGITCSQETVDKTEGAAAFRINKPAGSYNCRAHSNTVFACNPGDTITYEADVKSTVNGTFYTGLLTASTSSGCDFYSGDPFLSNTDRLHALTGAAAYRRVRASWTVPAGCYFGRFSLHYDTTGNVAGTIRIDNSASSLTASPPSGIDPHHMRRNSSTAQTLTNGTITTLLFETQVEVVGSVTYAAATGTFTINAAGRYTISAGVAWANNATGRRTMVIYRNGVSLSTGDQPGNASNVTNNQTISADLAIGDTITVAGYQSSGVSLATTTSPDRNYASITMVGGSKGDAGIPGSMLVPQRQVFTTTGSQTWTKPAGFVYAEVECQGGGGGGGGVSNSTATTADAGASGGGGGYTKKIWLDAALNATEAVVVGVGGTAGAANDAAAGTGGNSTFKATQIGSGGGGASAATGNVGLARSTGGSGGGGSGGDYTVAGGDGPNGSVIANGGGTAPTVQAINGGASFLGGACRPAVSAAGGVGAAGQVYGGGGGAGYSRAASGAFAGGAGAPGIVIVTSYCAT